MAAGGELLTLQVGTAANFVGAHFWNVQDELLQTDAEDDADGPAQGWDARRDLAEEDRGEGASESVSRELRPEMLFRVGRTAATPRVVVVGEKGFSGALQTADTGAWRDASPAAVLGLRDDQLKEQAAGIWDGAIEVHREEAMRKSDFVSWLEEQASQVEQVAAGGWQPPAAPGAGQANDGEVGDGDDFLEHRVREEQVRGWSDFLKAQLHPRSVNLLHRYGDQDLSTFVSGAELLGQGAEREELFDSVRFFLEECDRLQGVHLVADVDGFGGVARELLQEFQDEAPKCPVLCMGVAGPEPEHRNEAQAASYKRRRGINEALAMRSFSETCALYVPMPLYSLRGVMASPYVARDRYRPTSLFHTSFLAAAGLESVSLPYRRARPSFGDTSAVSLQELATRLAPGGDTRVAALSMAMPLPFPILSEADLGAMLEKWAPLNDPKSPLPLHLSTVTESLPGEAQAHATFGTSLVLRGAWPTGVDFEAARSGLESRLADYAARSPIRLSPSPLVTAVRAPLPVTLATPDIFNNALLGPRGALRIRPAGSAGSAGAAPLSPPLSLPTLSLLETSTRSGDTVSRAHQALARASLVSKLEYSKGPRGMDAEELSAAAEALGHLAATYTCK